MNNTEKEYLGDSAGCIMTGSVPRVTWDVTIDGVREMLKESASQLDTINYIYVLDEKNVLLGVLSMKEVFKSDGDVLVSSIMRTDINSVLPGVDQEHVALLAIEKEIKAVPVVDDKGVLLGVVQYDSILNVLHAEDIEDALLSAGLLVKEGDPAVSIIKASATTHIIKRLPWLLIGLLGGILAAFIVELFEEPLRQELALAAFIPAVVYMADAVGSQAQTIFIRSVALERNMSVKKYVHRELIVNFILALMLGLLLGVVGLYLWQSVLLGVTLAISLFLTIVLAMVVGIFFPWLFMRSGFDPAFSSGPFATVVRDIMSLVIYFLVARSMLSLL